MTIRRYQSIQRDVKGWSGGEGRAQHAYKPGNSAISISTPGNSNRTRASDLHRGGLDLGECRRMGVENNGRLSSETRDSLLK